MKLPLLILATIALVLGVIVSALTTDSASNKIVFKEHPTLVACYDYSKGTFHTPKNDSCLIGKTMKNVYLPSAFQMRLIMEVYVSRNAMYQPLAIINGESQFDINARGCNKYTCASGIMQVADFNGGLFMDTYDQLVWFRDRKEHQITV